MKKTLIFILIIASWPLLADVFVEKPAGAAAKAMAGSVVAVGNDIYSAKGNPAGLGFMEGNGVAVMFFQPYGLSELNQQQLFFGLNTQLPSYKSQVFYAFGYDSFGSGSLYYERILSGHLAYCFSKKYSAGFTVKHLGLEINGDNDSLRASAFALDAGIDIKLGNNLFIGYVGKNLLAGSLEYDDTDLGVSGSFEAPVSHQVGIGYAHTKFGKAEIGSDLTSVRFGVEIMPVSYLRLRYGFCYNFASLTDLEGKTLTDLGNSFGIGIYSGRLRFDYSLALQSGLPLSHAVSASTTFGSPKIIRKNDSSKN